MNSQKLRLLAALASLSIVASAWSATFEEDYRRLTWDQTVAAAKGKTVNFFMYGGSSADNKYVTGYIAQNLKQKYDVTLNFVPVNTTLDAVNKVLAEKQAGKDKGGSVDLVWINGENFRTMKQGNVLFRNWSDLLPSSKFVDWKNPAIANDFGVPVDYDESPWRSATFVMEYDSAKVPNPPKNIPDLLKWACDNKGKFAYPAVPDFTGSVFIRHVFYAAAGDYKKLMIPFNEAVYNEVSAKTWKMLNDVKPCLWREGKTYPESNTKLFDLLAQTEVWMAQTYGPNHAANLILQGKYPASMRTFVFDTGTIGNTNYVAIPYNSANKAAAMVMADFLLSPEAQLEGGKPSVIGFRTPLSMELLPKDIVAKFAALPQHPAILDDVTLNKNKLPELQVNWITRIEKDWKTFVLEK